MFLKSLLIFIFSSTAFAEMMPATLRDGSTRFLSRSLGSACYTMASVERGLPCNPAAIAKDRKARFNADLFIGANVDYIKDAEDILRGKDDVDTVSKFFARRDSVDAEASIEASYIAPKWGLSVEPYRVVAVTHFENPALPMVDMVLAEEQNVKGQIATYAYDNFYAGLQARYTHVRFIGQYFSISEALAGNRDELFAAETQELFYLEPGVMYAWEEVTWQPQISAMLSHWGFSDRKTDEYPIQPEGLLGASIKPMVPLGLLELGVQFKINSQTQNARDAFRGAFGL